MLVPPNQDLCKELERVQAHIEEMELQAHHTTVQRSHTAAASPCHLSTHTGLGDDIRVIATESRKMSPDITVDDCRNELALR